MTPRYTARRSDWPGSPWWYIIDAVTGGEVLYSVDTVSAEVDCGLPDNVGHNCYTEAQARAVADWLNQHDTTHPDDIPAPE